MSVSGFRSELDLRDNGDGCTFVLLAPLHYLSEMFDGTLTVPAGFETDLASIPLISNHRKWSKAAVVHDYCYRMGPALDKRITRAFADGLLGEAMACLNIPRWRRWVVLSQLKVWGWRAWNGHRERDHVVVSS